MNFWDALRELMFGNSGRVSISYQGYGILVFAVGSAFMGFIAVFLDWIAFSVRGRSFFNLTYGKTARNTLRLWCLWGLGAGLGGYLGSAVSIVELTRAACIGVGVGWPLILPRLIDSFIRDAEDEDEQNPEGN